MRFLPPEVERDLGLTPYLWLAFSIPFLINPFIDRRPLSEILVTPVAWLLFLVLYLSGFWRNGPPLLANVAAMTLLGVIFAPVNPGAVCFFIFAAGHAAWTGPPRHALAVIGVILAVISLTVLAFGLPFPFWLIASAFSATVGGAYVQFAQVSQANDRLRVAQQEVERLAKVAERERIARDLHDVLGHALSVVVLKAELAAKLLGRDADAAAREIGDVERISRDALREVRATVAGYRASLAGEVARAEEALRAAGVAFDAKLARPCLNPVQESVLALALREGVTNVVRHSGARACRVRLEEDGHRACLMIEDDGRGHDDAGEGSGLAGMRERVAALGGTLDRWSEEGTRLRIILPMEAPT